MNTTTNIFERLAESNRQSNFASFYSEPESEQMSSKEVSEDQGDIFERFAKKEEQKQAQKFGFLETAKDIGQQVASKAVSGFGGAYGNIAESLGIQPKEQLTLPGEEQINSIRSNTLDKLNRGETPSLGELLVLSDDELEKFQLPTSEQIQAEIQKQTGIGEGKTPAGRIAGRGAEFLGEGLAVPGAGLKNLTALGLSGATGQGIREVGAPEALATGTEILGPVVSSAISGKLIPSGKNAKDIVKAGRELGLTEKQITPLVQGEKKLATLSKVARKGTKTKERFADIKETLGDSYNSIKSKPEAKVNIPFRDRTTLKNEFVNIREDLAKTLSPSPDREAAMNFIDRAIASLGDEVITPEYLVNFWQDINKSVKWNSIQGGKKALAQLKSPLSKTLEKVSPELAKDFDMTNQLYSKYAQISKKLKPDLVDSIFNKAEMLAVPTAGIALAQGNPWILVGLASENALRLLGREMLINPYFQNIGQKMVSNFNQGSLKSLTRSVEEVKTYLDKKNPNEDWSFLIQDRTE